MNEATQERYFQVTELVPGSTMQTKRSMGEISDGYHTFDELYRYRMLYNALFFNMIAGQAEYDVHKSKFHSDGEPCFGGGWFVVVAYLPTGQITNHYELKDWDKFKIEERNRAAEWDGASPAEVADRIEAFLLEDHDA